MSDSNEFQVMNNLNEIIIGSVSGGGGVVSRGDNKNDERDTNDRILLSTSSSSTMNPTTSTSSNNEKRRRTNYSLGGNKAKIEEAVKYLLELSERSRPNVRNVAEKVIFSLLLLLPFLFHLFLPTSLFLDGNTL